MSLLHRRAILFALLLLVFACLAAGVMDDEGGHPLHLASVEVSKGNYQSALDIAQQALVAAASPHDQARIHLLSGYCDFKLGNHESARQDLRNASALYPELSFHGLYYGALSYQETRQFDQAVILWEKLIESDPPGDLMGRALMELLRCHRKGENAGATLHTLDRIGRVAGDPEWSCELDYSRGWAKAELGASAEARSVLLNLWKRRPESFWADMAAKYLEGDQKEKLLLPGESSAISDADRVQRIEVLIDRHLPAQALTELKPIFDKVETSADGRLYDMLKLRGRAHEERRWFTQAIADFEKAQSLRPGEDVELTFMIANCLRRTGDHDNAIDAYQRIWTDYSECPFATRALYYAARLLKLANNWDGAEAAYRKLANDYPHSTLRPEALFQIAWLNYLRGDYKKSLMYLERVPEMSRDPEFNARTLYWQSVVLHKLRSHRKATEIEDRILKDYWKSAYGFYLVIYRGRGWPYPAGGKVIPLMQDEIPLEYYISRELYSLGLDQDAEGQLSSLEDRGRLPEWLAWSVSDMYLQLQDYYRAQAVSNRHLAHRLATPPPGEKEAWQVAYPQAYPDLVNKYCRQYKLDPLLVWSLMRAESTYRPYIKSRVGALGLMQIMPATGRQIARGLGEKGFSKDSLLDPEVNIRYGCYYLRGRLMQFTGEKKSPETWLATITRSLASYNGGPERVSRWAVRSDALGLSPEAFVEEIPLKETREYVKRILKFYLVYLTTWPRVEADQAQSDGGESSRSQVQ